MKNDEYLVYTKTTGTFAAATNIDGITAFKTIDGYENVLSDVTGTLNTVTDASGDATDITLYNCNKGKCRKSIGYILIDTASVIKKCDTNGCNIAVGSDKVDNAEGCSAGIGKVFISTNIKLCDTVSSGKDTGVYFLGNPLKMYNFNTAKTIVGIPTPGKIFYKKLYKNNNLF